MKLKFNHSAETISESTGIDTERLSEKITKTLNHFIKDEENQTISQLSEVINKDFTKAELVILSTQHLIKTLQENNRTIEDTTSEFTEVLEESETESE
jgi:hypothetical protein|tara:strand:+ start:913 stop:1206 length:294 start_codon:yes stop_codon:yes gene_type:complete